MRASPMGCEVSGGPATSFEGGQPGIATYYYRVKARNGWGDGGWSVVQAAAVRWEADPNDQIPQLDSASRLIFGQEHYGAMSSDADVAPDNNLGRDYFYFDLATFAAGGYLAAERPGGQASSDLYVRPDWDVQVVVGQSRQCGEHGQEHIRLASLAAGHRFFVRVLQPESHPNRVAVSAGHSVVSDTGLVSIRKPALAGLRPSQGTVSSTGVLPEDRP